MVESGGKPSTNHRGDFVIMDFFSIPVSQSGGVSLVLLGSTRLWHRPLECMATGQAWWIVFLDRMGRG